MLPELAEIASARLAEDGVDPTALTVTSGALDGIERLLAAHLRPGDRVAIEDPSWANLIDLVAALGLEPVPVAVDDEGPTPAATHAALATGARAFVVTTRAQNPSGAAVSARRATALRAVLAAYPQVLVIEDDHAAELSAVPLASLAGATRSWAFLRSVSKPYGPDLRVAVLAGDEATVARVAGRMRVGAGWVSTLLQRLVVALWRDPAVAAAVAAARDSYERRRTDLREALSRHGVASTGRTGINVWIPVARRDPRGHRAARRGVRGRARLDLPHQLGAGCTDHRQPPGRRRHRAARGGGGAGRRRYAVAVVQRVGCCPASTTCAARASRTPTRSTARRRRTCGGSSTRSWLPRPDGWTPVATG